MTDGNAVAVGKLLNVPAVLVVRITEYAVETQFDAKKRARNRILFRTATVRACLGAPLIDRAEASSPFFSSAPAFAAAGGERWRGDRGIAPQPVTGGQSSPSGETAGRGGPICHIRADVSAEPHFAQARLGRAKRVPLRERWRAMCPPPYVDLVRLAIFTATSRFEMTPSPCGGSDPPTVL